MRSPSRRHGRPPRARFNAAAWLLQHLEPRCFLSAADPSASEQQILWLLNRMRTDPADELPLLLNSSDPQVQHALSYFQVDQTLLAQQWSQLAPVAPLAWNANLAAAAAIHTQNMVLADQQSHQLPNEPSPADRITAAGYAFSAAGENVYAYAVNPDYCHAAFAIDWGAGDTTIGGIQNPPGHRIQMMSSAYRDVGISWMPQSATRPDGSLALTGPFLATEDFAAPAAPSNAALVGTVYTDANHNAAYDPGEGLGDVTITATSDRASFATTSLSAGGYALTLPDGTYTVTFSGPAIPSNALGTSFPITIAGQNVLQDLQTTTIIAGGSGNSPLRGAVEAWTNYPVPIGPSAVSGFAADPDTPNAGYDPVTVRLDIDGIHGAPIPANLPRPDLLATLGSPDHGFTLPIPVLSAGTHRLSVVASNYPSGTDVLLASRTFTLSGNPVGFVDSFTTSTISGWAFDPDAGAHGTGPVAIRVDVDGRPVAGYAASTPRANLVPALGSANHAFSIPLPIAGTTPGPHRYDVWVLNVGGGSTPAVLIASKTLTVSSPPVGTLESASPYQLSGWVADPDSPAAPATIALLVDGRFLRALNTNWLRPDLHAFGSAPFGFVTLTPPLAPGLHLISLYGIDDKTRAPVLLSARNLYEPPAFNRLPIGNVESLSAASISGWALDPDSTTPAVVIVTADDQPLAAVFASAPRPDLASYVGSTPHGFSLTLNPNALAPGAHTLRVYVLDMQTGARVLLATQSITVASPPPPPDPDPTPPDDPSAPVTLPS